MKYLLSLLTLLIALVVPTACMDDEDYTVSPNDELRFSTDTVAFDTIISGAPTNTYTFTVYNDAKKAIRIPRVELEAGAASPFYVNVDGTPLTNGAASDFEISAKDSLIVYLMANTQAGDSDLPVEVSDRLRFTLESGRTQEIMLTASGQDVITLRGERITESTILASRRPYRIMDSLVVEAGQTLTLMPGVRLYFHPKAELIVRGTLKSLGTMGEPVEMRGDRLGNMFAGQPYDRIPGQWGGITFKEESYDNYLTYTDIHSGTYGIRVDSCDVGRTTLTLENSIIHNVSGDGMNLRMAGVYVGNSQITNAGGNCVTIRGGDMTFVHTTIARFFVFTGGNGTALNFANYDGETRLPITRLQFANSIITGYQSDEIMGSQNMKHEKDDFNYAFFNCLINTPKTEEENQRLINCLWDLDEGTAAEGDTVVTREANFLPLPDLKALTFSFQLSPHSKAVGGGDPTISAQTYPADPLGRSREGHSDIGCYQYIGSTESIKSK